MNLQKRLLISEIMKNLNRNIVSGSFMRFAIVFALMAVIALPFGICASSPLDATLAKINTTKSVSVTFHYNSANAKVPGTLVMQQNRYKASSGNFSVWYDGKTMWVYNAKTKEVNISEPNAEELAQSNPFVILSSASTAYTVKKLTPANGLSRVMLTPKTKNTGILRATVSIGRDSWPKGIDVEFSSGDTMNFVVTKITPGKQLGASTFKFDPKKYAVSETIDLR